MNRGLIFDIGFHVGQDTDYYLKKGFAVVAIDANPILIEEGKKRFAKDIADGRLVLINIGIGDRSDTLPFYVNKTLSEWSSFDKQIGTLRGEYYVIEVPLVSLRSIIEEHGTPYYLKADIEGYDLMAVKSIRDVSDKPQYISIENGQAHMIEELHNQGYQKFKFINQANIQETTLKPPAKEGSYVDYKFPFGSSGPFGEETAGAWLSKDEVLKLSNAYWGNPNRDANIHGWYDLHASL